MSSLLNELRMTSLFIGEIDTKYESVGVEKFVTQGMITLDISETNGILRRSLLVRKMRFTSHDMKRHEFVIGKSGIKISKTSSKEKK